jgi:hypothetical protein
VYHETGDDRYLSVCETPSPRRGGILYDFSRFAHRIAGRSPTPPLLPNRALGSMHRRLVTWQFYRDDRFVIATSYRKLRTSRNIDKLDTGGFT